MKRVINAFGLVVLVFALAAFMQSCEKNTETDGTSDVSNVYKSTKIEYPDYFEADLNDLILSGGEIDVYGWTKYVEGTTEPQKRLLLRLDTESGDITVDNLGEMDSEMRTLSVTYSASGDKYTVEALPSEDNIGYDSISIVRSSGDEIIAEYDCGELFELDISKMKVTIAGEGGFYVRSVFDYNGGILIVSNTGVAVVAQDGGKRHFDSQYEINSAAFTDGRLILFYTKNSEMTISYFDLDAFKLTDPIEIDTRSVVMIPFALDGFEFGTATNDGIFAYSRGADGSLTSERLCDFVRSDICGQVNSVISFSRDCFYVTMYEAFGYSKSLYRLDMIPKSELVEKKTLTLAVLAEADYLLKNAVVDFNLSNSEYRIEIVSYDYEQASNGAVDVSGAITRFNNDIAAGNIPDIIVAAEFFGVEPELYAEKGLFCDLYGVIDEDPDFSRDELLQCVRSIEREDTKTGENILPYLPLYSQVWSMCGDTALFPDGLTLKSALDTIDSLDDGVRLMNYYFPGYLMSLLKYDLEAFIDYTTGETNFEDETFIRFCELYKKGCDRSFSPAIITEGGDDWAAVREGKVLLRESNRFDLYSIIKMRANSAIDTFGVVGYPDEDSSGIILKPNYVYGITNKCEAKNAAWEFLKIRISDKYLLESNTGIPLVTQGAFDKYFDEYGRYYYIGYQSGAQISKTPIDIENAKLIIGDGFSGEADDALIDYIKNIYLTARIEPPINAKILAIIDEELANYAGRDDLSASDAAKIINSRVSILYSEQN